MSTPSRDFSRESWRLKLARAKKHLEELEGMIRAYGDRRPYTVRRRLESKKDRNVWRFHLVMEQPDPEMGIVLGDAVHNLRAALDHLVVAIAPKDAERSAGFPIENRNVWAKKDRTYTCQDRSAREARAGFHRRIKALPREVQAYIHAVQPYRHTPPHRNALSILNRFENADKHSKLIVFAFGLMDATVGLEVLGWGGPPVQRIGLAENGAKLVQVPPPPGLTTDAPVQVQVDGTPKITVDVGLEEKADIVETLKAIIRSLEDRFFPMLETFVR